MRIALSGMKVKDDEVSVVVQIGSDADVLVTQTIKCKPVSLTATDVATGLLPEVQSIVNTYKNKIKIYQDIETITGFLNDQIKW